MKNLFIYYLLIFIPLPILFYIGKLKSELFIFSFILYLVYRGFLDANRLVKIGVISKKDFYQSFIPFWKLKYFYELYFKK